MDSLEPQSIWIEFRECLNLTDKRTHTSLFSEMFNWKLENPASMNVGKNLSACDLLTSRNHRYFQIPVKLGQIFQNLIYAHHSLKNTAASVLSLPVHRHSCTGAGQLQCSSGPPNGESI